MEKIFKGRKITGTSATCEAIVSHGGVNTLATFQKSALKNAKKVIASDQNNKDIFGKVLTDKALCLPQTIGSTTGGLVIQTICQMKINPKCFLFSKDIDSLAASGVLLASIWEKSDVVTVDRLGDEFLDYVETGDTIEVLDDGSVKVIKNK